MDIIEVIDLARDTLEKHAKNTTNEFFGEPDDWAIVIKKINSLGLCSFSDKEIIISIDHMNNHTNEAVRDTILHECAHALAGVEITRTGRVMGHGRLFRRWAVRVGADPSAKTESKSLHKEGTSKEEIYRGEKYYIVSFVDGKVEIVSGCKRKLKNLERKSMKNRRDTVGKLWHIPVPVYEKHKGNVEILERHLFR